MIFTEHNFNPAAASNIPYFKKLTCNKKRKMLLICEVFAIKLDV